MNNFSLKNIINITIFAQIYNDLENINQSKNNDSKIYLKLFINIIFLLLSFLIAISCNNTWRSRFIGIFLSFLFAPLYMIYKLLNPSITINPKLCLNFNFKDRILSAFQNK